MVELNNAGELSKIILPLPHCHCLLVASAAAGSKSSLCPAGWSGQRWDAPPAPDALPSSRCRWKRHRLRSTMSGSWHCNQNKPVEKFKSVIKFAFPVADVYVIQQQKFAGVAEQNHNVHYDLEIDTLPGWGSVNEKVRFWTFWKVGVFVCPISRVRLTLLAGMFLKRLKIATMSFLFGHWSAMIDLLSAGWPT